MWRMGFVESFSPVFNSWIRLNETVTIRPDETPEDVAWRLSREPGRACGTVKPKLRIVVWDH